jgi:hypothetical protein
MHKRSNELGGTALDSLIACKAEIDALLARLQDASANHFNANPDEINWGHAGSLGHVAEKLKEIAKFLNV